MREGGAGGAGAGARQRLLEVAEDLEAELAVPLAALVLVELVEAAGAQLLAVLQQPEVLEVLGLPGVDGAALHVALAVAEGRPALHLLPATRVTGESRIVG